MRQKWCRIAAALAVAIGLQSASAPMHAQSLPKWVSGFYVGYMADRLPPDAIDFSSLTHVFVFSVLPQPHGALDTTLFVDPVNGPRIAQQASILAHQAGKKAILTVGGDGTADAFRSATSSDAVATFVRRLLDTVNSWGFDGVDIDWEPLAADDYSSVLDLISRVKTSQPGLIVTMDVPWQSPNFPLTEVDARFFAQAAARVDQMNMMTYGMAGSWDGWVVWHSSALSGDGPDHPSSVQSSAHEYLASGVPPAKLGIGIGFYGSCWSAPATAPLQPLRGSTVVAEDNDMSFAAIQQQYFSPAVYHFDSVARVPYLSFTDPAGPRRCTFVSYEDENSVAAKAQYVKDAGLGGAIVWQINEGYIPDAADPNRLLHAVGAAFGVGPAAIGTGRRARHR